MKKVKPRLSKLPPAWVTYSVEQGAWVLMDSYRVQLLNRANEYKPFGFFTVDAGFEFDLSSIPSVFRALIERHDLSIVAPLIHDALYAADGLVFLSQRPGGPEGLHKFNRKEADNIFLELMEAEGVPKLRRWLAYRAVRSFGGMFWNRVTKMS